MNDQINNFNDLDIQDDKILGTGYISKVKLARSKSTGKFYAVKIVS